MPPSEEPPRHPRAIVHVENPLHGRVSSAVSGSRQANRRRPVAVSLAIRLRFRRFRGGAPSIGTQANTERRPMYERILAPVDLAHPDRIEKALRTASDLASHYGSDLVLVGVTGIEPSAVAHNPEEFASKLADFAAAAGDRFGHPMRSEMVKVHDLTIDLDGAITRKAAEIGADLVVMASHRPGAGEYIFGSNAGHVAQHSPVSVLVVRD
jgi:nucleotide-binding universal stress UspA family protein